MAEPRPRSRHAALLHAMSRTKRPQTILTLGTDPATLLSLDHAARVSCAARTTMARRVLEEWASAYAAQHGLALPALTPEAARAMGSARARFRRKARPGDVPALGAPDRAWFARQTAGQMPDDPAEREGLLVAFERGFAEEAGKGNG